MENETIYRLSEINNIAGLKDCSGNIKQTAELLMNPPKDFSILTGEDLLFFLTLTMGGQGGILSSAHLKTEQFVEVYNKIKENDLEAALKLWKPLYDFIPLLFKEPNPAPVKYCLEKLSLIDSDEVRLPLTEISDQLKDKINSIILK